MKSVSAGLVTFLSKSQPRKPACIEVFPVDADDETITSKIVRGTNYGEDLTIDSEIFYHTSGADSTDTEYQATLDASNTEITGNFDRITAADLKAGVYDNARYNLFLVNPDDPTQGRYKQQSGRLSTVTIDRLTFVLELLDLMAELQQSFGLTCTPGCPYTLGSIKRRAFGGGDCGKDLTAFKRTGTLESVSADQLTFTDPARTEPGPAGGVAIDDISNTNPVVFTVTGHGFAHGDVVTNSEIDGPIALNGPMVVRNPTTDTYEGDIDTTETDDYPPFVSGTVTPEGAEAGYFTYGLMRCTDAASPNFGLAREIRSYVPGQWTLQNTFSFPFAGDEDYELTAGCAKDYDTCDTKFDNHLNFGGYREVPGQDRVMQVARRE